MKRIHLILSLVFFGVVGFAIQGTNYAQPLTASAPSRTATRSAEPSITLPRRDGSVRVAVFGDAGRGTRDQYDLGKVMEEYRKAFPFELVLLTGDNIYGKDSPADMKNKFELPYKPLLDAGVLFYGSLGNHDTANQRLYAPFNMKGEEYYRIERSGVSFYALNSNYLDKKQLDWLNSEVEKDKNSWRVAFFHHPPYSSGGRHGSDEDVRAILHPLFVKNGFDVVFTGHDHFYERVKPQDGITYFVAGAAGKIRKGDLKESSTITAAGFDTDLSFMIVEFVDDEMHFQVISKAGKTVDSGVVRKRD